MDMKSGPIDEPLVPADEKNTVYPEPRANGFDRNMQALEEIIDAPFTLSYLESRGFTVPETLKEFRDEAAQDEELTQTEPQSEYREHEAILPSRERQPSHAATSVAARPSRYHNFSEWLEMNRVAIHMESVILPRLFDEVVREETALLSEILSYNSNNKSRRAAKTNRNGQPRQTEKQRRK